MVNTCSEESQKLYEALVKACTEHSAHLHLEFAPSQKDGTFKFELGMRELGSSTSSQQPPNWITIMSQSTAAPCPLASGDRMSGLVSNMQLRPQPTLVPSTGALAASFTIGTVHTEDSPETAMNLCENGRFCSKLKELIMVASQGRSCVGFVEDGDASSPRRYTVLTLPRSMVSAAQKAAMSLRLLLAGAQQHSQSRRLTLFERFRLARQIATAILQLSNTSWLDTFVSMEQIYLYGVGEETLYDEEPPSPEPYLEVSFRAPQVALASTATPLMTPTIRNALLFRLGVILLKLAFEKPLQELRSSEDLFEGREYPNSDWNTAARSSRRVSEKMGPRYSKIIERCLWCDFACGESELKSPELQRKVQRHVVRELEELEKGQREILGWS